MCDRGDDRTNERATSEEHEHRDLRGVGRGNDGKEEREIDSMVWLDALVRLLAGWIAGNGGIEWVTGFVCVCLLLWSWVHFGHRAIVNRES